MLTVDMVSVEKRNKKASGEFRKLYSYGHHNRLHVVTDEEVEGGIMNYQRR